MAAGQLLRKGGIGTMCAGHLDYHVSEIPSCAAFGAGEVDRSSVNVQILQLQCGINVILIECVVPSGSSSWHGERRPVASNRHPSAVVAPNFTRFRSSSFTSKAANNDHSSSSSESSSTTISYHPPPPNCALLGPKFLKPNRS